MKVYLFRHGEKSFHGGPNPGLSPHGLDQAKALAHAVSKQQLETPSEILVSPKLRSQETFMPMAHTCGIAFQIRAELDEKGAFETHAAAVQRIAHFLDHLEMHFPKATVIYLCTHMDWLEIAIDHLQSSSGAAATPALFQPCEWILAELNSREWSIVNKGVFL